MNHRLQDLIGQCVVVTLINGDEITGFLRGINGASGLVRLFVAGEVVWVPLHNVVTIRRAQGAAC